MRLTGGPHSGPALATAPYTAPEIFHGELPTPESDRFSFAATLFHVLTGEVPPLRAYGLGPDPDAIQRILTASPLTAQRPELCSTILAGLASLPQHRPTRLVPWISSVRSSSTLVPAIPRPPGSASHDAAPAPTATAPARRRLRQGLVAAAVLLLVIAAVAGWALSRPDGRGSTGTPSAPARSASTAAASSAAPGEFATSAAASPSASRSPDIDSAAPPVNLGDSRQRMITSTNGFGPATQVTINAKTFTYGFSGCQIACQSASVDVDLGRSYSTLTARLGVRDSSKQGGSAHIQILADGKVIASETVRLGVSRDIQVSVKNVLRLQFVESNDGGVIAAVGDPTVTP
jgi:serine/threonine protein kinase